MDVGKETPQLLSNTLDLLVSTLILTFVVFNSYFSASSSTMPLIFSGIFYAANGRNHIAYIDCLFNCVSAMTVCGLATVDLSLLTPFQQFLLVFQALVGNPVGIPNFSHITTYEIEK